MINKSILSLTTTLFKAGSRNALQQGRLALPALNLEHNTTNSLFYQPKRGFFGRKKPEEQEKKQNEKETTEKKEEPKNTQKEDNTAETKEKTKTEGQETKKDSKQESSSSSSSDDDTNGTAEPTMQNLIKLLNEKPQGYESQVRQLFKKQEQELELKTKRIDELVQNLKAEEGATKEWHKKVDSLRKSVKEAEEDSALTRKRYEKMMEDSKVFSISKFAKDLLEIPDNLERAVDAVKDDKLKETELFQGVVATHSILLKTLERHGVTRIYPLKEKFDPNKHEALFDYDDPTAEPGTCGVVALPGYVIADRILRPAKVGVIKKRN
eukprot:CAMPEP_0176424440 /NCGR_PEP_ID=MMETSP0127-20121128/10838_1 /TAXON_ID=938130 /ORGANISM="Platyophrya macrostoma, Strain WH" /LENGTH=323 /DNA_ID=CAMNT_0017805497 /DNA_START=41 /DNA_END=1012 /DNA_ORIENTATION=-